MRFMGHFLIISSRVQWKNFNIFVIHFRESKIIRIKTYYFFLCLIVFSCSKEEEPAENRIKKTVTPPETFDSWSPNFDNQTSDFNQTRSGSKGTDQSIAITVTSSQDIELDEEKNILSP